MKNKLIRIVWFIMTALAFNSCSKFLNEQSQSEIIPRTTTDFSELLLGSGYQGYTDPMPFILLMDDDFEFFIDYAQGTPGEYVNVKEAKKNFPYYTWQPYCQDFDGNNLAINTGDSEGAYFNFYKFIMGCNAVLDHIDNAIGTKQEIDRVKAEALANRAFHYFRLVNLFGEPYNHNKKALGVPLKLTSNITHEYLERNTVEEVYDQVVVDLREAIRLMEPLPVVRGDFRINLPAMHIILSRVYLYMENWDSVVAQTNKAFDLGIRHLDLTNYAYTSALPPSYLLYENNPEVQWVFGGSTTTQLQYHNPPVSIRPWFSGNKMTKVGDARGVECVRFDASKYYQAFFYKVGLASPTLNQAIRTAEACLNRAEAYAQLGKLAEAREDLNTLRKNRIYENSYVDVVDNNKEDLLDKIRLERRLEFYGEHFRWFDLRRYGMPEIKHRYKHAQGEQVLVYTLAEKDPMYTLPFPRSHLLRNPSLEQNASASIPERAGIPEI